MKMIYTHNIQRDIFFDCEPNTTNNTHDEYIEYEEVPVLTLRQELAKRFLEKIMFPFLKIVGIIILLGILFSILSLFCR